MIWVTKTSLDTFWATRDQIVADTSSWNRITIFRDSNWSFPLGSLAAPEWVHWGWGRGRSLLKGRVLDSLSLWSWRMYTCHAHSQWWFLWPLTWRGSDGTSHTDSGAPLLLSQLIHSHQQWEHQQDVSTWEKGDFPSNTWSIALTESWRHSSISLSSYVGISNCTPILYHLQHAKCSALMGDLSDSPVPVGKKRSFQSAEFPVSLQSLDWHSQIYASIIYQGLFSSQTCPLWK